MKPSRFNVEVPLAAGNEECTILFNTFTQALALLPCSVWESIKKSEQPTGNERVIEQCSRQMFLIGNEVDETRLLLARKQEAANDTSSLLFKIMVTDHCNFACSYCVEEGFRGRRSMNASLVRETVFFIVSRIQSLRPHTVQLDFSGGEPLLNVMAIRRIAEAVYYYCRGAGIKFGFSFICNGSLLSPELVKDLRKIGLRAVRVTLLPREYHDRMRRDRKGKATFDSVVENMKKVMQVTPLVLYLQYDAEDELFTRALIPFLDHLDEAGIRAHLQEMVVGPILKREYGFGNGEGNYCGELGSFNRYKEILDTLKSRGFPLPDEAPASDCMANNRGKFIIDPSGDLISCPAMLDHKAFTVGHVATGVNPVRKAMIANRTLPEQCMENCALAPRCNGGCRYQALLRSGSFDKIYCNYDFHIAQVRDYVRQKASAHLAAAATPPVS